MANIFRNCWLRLSPGLACLLLAGCNIEPDKPSFIAVHDYQHGAVAVRVYAQSKEEVTNLLRPPSWTVYNEEDPNRPSWADESKFDTSDVNAPSELLKKLVYIQERQQEGKHQFMYRVTSHQGTEYRAIWARSSDEIEDRYPAFESLIGIGIGPWELNEMGTSDIDARDEFLDRHAP